MGDTSPMLWNAATIDQKLYRMFLDQIVSLALTRFEWVNLPPTCDERFLEWTLLTDGMATIACPKKQMGTFYSTQAVMEGVPNVYQNPCKWRSYGVNNWSFYVNHENGVFIYDNRLRYSIWPAMQVYARELTDIMRTKQINRQHSRMPFVITAPQEQKLTMENVWNAIVSGEAAILGYNALTDNIKVEAVQTGVTYLGEELEQDMLNVWNEVYRMLGIPNMPMKMERQIEDEVHNYQAPTDIFRLDPLSMRRDACDKLNARFSEFLDAPIDCVFRTDYESNNFRVKHDIKESMELMNG